MKSDYKNLLNIDKTIAKDLFEKIEYPWEVLPLIGEYIISIGNNLGSDYEEKGDNIWIHKTAKIESSALIKGPTIICEGAELRQSAFIRGKAIIGKNCVVGNSTEVKNAILFDDAKAPHFNYIGDAIMGANSHIGAGVILSNVKSDNSTVVVKDGSNNISTGLRKMSAILGDRVDVGCNSVVCPGSIIYPDTNVYPLTRVRGVIERNKIVKSMDNIVEKEER